MTALISGTVATASALLATGFARLPATTDGLFPGEGRGPGGVLLRAVSALRNAPDRAAILIGLVVGTGTLATMAISAAPVPAGIAIGLLGVVAAADARHMLLPETLLPPAAIIAAWAVHLAGAAQLALLSVTVAVAFGVLIPALRPGRIGMGDIPYLVIAALFVTPALLPFWLMAIGLMQTTAIRLSGSATLPFTPAIWLATVLAMVLAPFAGGLEP